MTDFQKFKEDVGKGLGSRNKYLSSKYFYDNTGSKLFTRIMDLPEYYLTNCEYEIFERQSAEMINQIVDSNDPIDVVELGAGDGSKTRLLIKELLSSGVRFRYIPVDISTESNIRLYRRFKALFPELEMEAVSKDYFNALEYLNKSSDNRKVIFFLGANVGNYQPSEAATFYRSFELKKGDKILTGFDLKKNPETILVAYNDSAGVTREFNLNLLRRINRELGADFDLQQFMHYPLYDPESGAAKSYLISRKQQTVFIGALGREFSFDPWELILTEISQKYDETMIGELAGSTGFRVKRNFTDSRNYFVDSLWEYTE